MAIQDVDPELEYYEEPIWWYGNAVYMNPDVYGGDVSEWKIETMQADEFQRIYDVPENLVMMFQSTDMLYTAFRENNDVGEIYIVIDSNTMIGGRNGLWYGLKKVIY